jgi:hypothetical protein
MPLHVNSIDLQRDGYLIVKNVFSPDEVARIRGLLDTARRRATAANRVDREADYPSLVMIHGDALAVDELRPMDYVVFESRIVGLVKQLLGPAVVYHGDSSAQIGEGPRGFHKDNSDRDNPRGVDWQGEYRVVRLGIYLQDHSRHSGGLKVRRRSHTHVSRHRGKAVNLDIQAGDVVAWYLTTTHSGNAVRIRGLPWLCLHPRLERLVPRPLREPESNERMAIFCSFGAPGSHLDHYIETQRARADVALHWRRCGIAPELAALATRCGVEMRRPVPDYGAESAASAK